MASESFGIEGELRALVGERDQNFRIETGGGAVRVLKISNRDEDPAVVDFQTAALRHIERTDPDLCVPRVVPTLDDAAFGWLESADGVRHLVRLLTFVPGRSLSGMTLTPKLFADLGRTLARLGLALRGFHHPAARHAMLWDLQQIPALVCYLDAIGDASLRATVSAILTRFVEETMPAMARLRAQVIHHDAHGNNVLVDPAHAETVSGFIDFGDMIHGPLIAELGVALSDIATDNDFEALAEAMVAGYDRLTALEEAEVDLIFDLALARHAASVVILSYREAVADAAHLAKYLPTAIAGIEAMQRLGRTALSSRLRRACCFPTVAAPSKNVEPPLERRHRLLGSSLELSYDKPVHLVRGEGAWLFDLDGRRFLDGYNNVPQVGHAHPRVARAISRQVEALNTNTRYLFDVILNYAERLTSTLPDGLDCCAFVNSGSEANDIAWRMARHATGAAGALVMENAYHGITEATAAFSPESVVSQPGHVRTLIAPDPYRGPFRAGTADLAQRYAADADRAIAELAAAGLSLAALIVDTGFASNGVPAVPSGYLEEVAAKVHAAGGLVIADEVQYGFGRSGSHFWGFETHGVVPDLVTMGKPVAAGYPCGIVVTSRDLRDRFGRDSGLFSTFGGNPVACAAALAVLDVIEQEGLLENARRTGDRLRAGLRELAKRHNIIGDVRGSGLLTGVEIVRDRETLEPAATEAKRIVNHMREDGVLIGKMGPHGNVLKIRPPLVFDGDQADMLVATLDRALEAL